MTRRESLTYLAALGLATSVSKMATAQTPLLTRAIPSTGEKLAAVGVGTWQTFDVGPNAAERDPLKDVLKNLVQNGGSVIDSSPMYGQSEKVAGDLSTELGLNRQLFMATKVWTTGEDAGIRQMKNSFKLLKREKIDLMQVHNLVDWQTHMKTLQAWKADGTIRYIGVTHYTDSSHATLAEIITRNPIDFVQVNYNLLDRNAEKQLLPAALQKGVAVIVNRPFEEGGLFQRVKGKALPAWAADFDCRSWAQFFLKFILSHPAVTCVIPGTSKLSHLVDNLGAARGKLPDERQRAMMVEAI